MAVNIHDVFTATPAIVGNCLARVGLRSIKTAVLLAVGGDQ
jgi:hypothetical protein